MMNYYTLIWKWPYNKPLKYELSTLIEKSKFIDEIVYLQCASFAPTFVVLEKWNVNVTSDWDYDGVVPSSIKTFNICIKIPTTIFFKCFEEYALK